MKYIQLHTMGLEFIECIIESTIEKYIKFLANELCFP
jgi:hypothetical protein